MHTSTATVPTAHASRYLQQLAKHWSHKFPVQFTPQAAAMDLPMGACSLRATDAELTVELKAPADADFERFEQVVAEHLQRFGHRETLAFVWRRGG